MFMLLLVTYVQPIPQNQIPSLKKFKILTKETLHTATELETKL
jgi:hypothetical protein